MSSTRLNLMAFTPILLIACLEVQQGRQQADDATTTLQQDSSPAQATAPETSATETESSPELQLCFSNGSSCDADGDCCTGICTGNDDFAGYCIDPVEDGSYCAGPHWCRSGRCEEDTCIPTTCIATGEDCSVNASCCSGICTYLGVYTDDARCIEPLTLGELCGRDEWCGSGFCVNGYCAVGECLEQGQDCAWGNERRCCFPNFCSWRMDYAPGWCTAPQAAGAPCLDASWCQSRICGEDGVCK